MRRGFTLIHLALGLAAVAIIATGIIFTTQQLKVAQTNGNSNTNLTETYTNETNGYSIQYPAAWTAREFPTGDGAGFQHQNQASDPSNEFISVMYVYRAENDRTMLFEEYVQVAAIHEIQNYEKILTSTTVTTSTGIMGVRTTWQYRDFDGMLKTSGPITYFPAPPGFSGSVQVMGNVRESGISGDELEQYDRMIQTFSYTNKVACTADAKLCPDGTYVGRSGPNCEFAACPKVESADEKQYQDSERHLSLRYTAPAVISVSENKVWINPTANPVNRLMWLTVADGSVVAVEQSLKTEYADGLLNDGTPRTAIDTEVGGRTARRLTYGTAIGLDDINYLVEWNGQVLRINFANTNDAATFEAIVKTIEYYVSTDDAATKDWKTYTNTTYGYSIKYPQTWKVNEVADKPKNDLSYINFDNGKVGEVKNSIEVSASTDTLQEWADGYKQAQVYSQTNITLGGQLASHVKTGEFGLEHIGVRSGSYLYVLTSNSDMLSNGMLDTFTFTK